MTNELIPPKLMEIISDFEISEGREKIELLLQYADQMPGLPEHIQKQHDTMEFVEECMTPVYVIAQPDENGMHFYFDVPAESPTVRGFAAIMALGLDGVTPVEILQLPNDFYQLMGLDQVLTMQRLNGISAILAHMKRIALQSLGNNNTG
jgi:cysteine desulfuration protein SufE